MNQGPLNKQLSDAKLMLGELREKCLSIAGEIGGYQTEIARVESSDIDLDTAAATVGVLKTKIGVLEKRESQAGAAYAAQNAKVVDLEKEIEAEIQSEIQRTAAVSVADLNAALAKLLPKFKHFQAAQSLAGNWSRWDDCIQSFVYEKFDSLAPLLTPNEGEKLELFDRIRDAV